MTTRQPGLISASWRSTENTLLLQPSNRTWPRSLTAVSPLRRDSIVLVMAVVTSEKTVANTTMPTSVRKME